MPFFFRNFHVYVFALLSVLAGSWVASNPDRTVQMVRPLVEDAVELKQLAEGAYRDVSQLNWQQASDEAVSMFVATMRMPTMLFDRLAEKLEKVEQDVKRGRRADATGADKPGLAEKASLPVDASQAGRRSIASNEFPEI